MWLFLSGTSLAAPSYTLSFDDRNANRVAVAAELPADATDLHMATWTPGSYLIREFAQHVSRVTATVAGEPVAVEKYAKNRWRIANAGQPYTLRYEVYAHDANVRGNWIDDEHGVLNGAATFIVPVGLHGPIDLDVQRPNGWSEVVTSLPRSGDGWRARDLDQLLDSPLLLGNPTITTFTVEGVEHRLVDLPAAKGWDSRKAADALQKVVEQNVRFWGEIPYDDYTFMNWIGEGRGGLEHADSTLMMTRRSTTSDASRFSGWLGLAAHEHFHAWNAKQLHPVGLGPFDYEREVYTPDLWIVEGITSYYDDLVLHRAGLISRDDYLDKLSRSLDSLANTPGQSAMSLEDASRDAWIKHYRPSEDSQNTTVSYYGKGALVAWVLDARIRELTDGKRSLDDVMLRAWTDLRGDPGYTTEQFLALVDEVAGQPMAPFLTPLVKGTAPLDPTTAMQTFGLTVAPMTDKAAAWLGVRLDGHTVQRIRADGPAAPSRLAVGDELLAIDGERVPGDLLAPLKRLEPGRRVDLLVARRGIVRTIPIVLGSKPHPVDVRVGPSNRRQERQRVAWLTGSP